MTLSKTHLSHNDLVPLSEVEQLLSKLEPQLSNFEAAENLSQADLARILVKRAQALAEAPPDLSPTKSLHLLVFWLGRERYGLQVSNVREIYPPQLLTAVPRTPHFLAGVFSARGRILSAIDLASFLGLPARPHRELAQTKIIVVTPTGPTAETIQLELGLLVDEVTDIITIFEDEAELSLATHTGVDYIRGITSDLLVVLDLNALLSDKRLIVNEEVL